MSRDNIGKKISYGDPKRISLSSVARALIKAGYVPEADVEAYGKGGKVWSKIKESTIYKLLDNLINLLYILKCQKRSKL